MCTDWSLFSSLSLVQSCECNNETLHDKRRNFKKINFFILLRFVCFSFVLTEWFSYNLVELDFVLDFFLFCEWWIKSDRSLWSSSTGRNVTGVQKTLDPVVWQRNETVPPTDASKLMHCLSCFMTHCKGSSLELVGSSHIRTLRTGFELPIKNPDFDLLTDRFCFVSEDPNQEHLCTTCMENNSFVEVRHGWKPGLQVFQSS